MAQHFSVDGILDDKVWRVEAQKGEIKMWELTAQAASDLTLAGDLEKRIGIVPIRVIEELRRN